MDSVFSLKNKRIWITGHRGMVGRAIMRRLEKEDVSILTTDFDLRDQTQTYDWIAKNKPDCVFMTAAKVGGVYANNTYPADFIFDNLAIQNNIIHGCHLADVEHLIFLGSSCIYPRDCPQPMSEDMLMSGPLEPTNSPYATAKLAGIEMIKSYTRQYGHNWVSVLPTNLYGPHDNFHDLNGHVPAVLLKRFHDAKVNNDPTVTIFGTGQTLREFMHVDDLADALVFLAKHYDDMPPINIGSAEEIKIQDFAMTIKNIVGYEGKIDNDLSKPDGTPRKLLNCSKLNDLGWHPNINLNDGLKSFYTWFLEFRA